MLVGIDSGGTSCRLVLCQRDGRVLRQCRVPGHNPNADGFAALEDSFRSGLNRLLTPFSGLETPLDGVFAGVAGGEGENRARLEDMLRRLLPRCAAVQVGSDAVIALTCGVGQRDGGVLIAGTGTVGFLRMGGRLLRFGGWGYLVDAGGSGFHIGRDGLRAAMAGRDAGLPATALTQLYEAALGMTMEQAIPALYRGDIIPAACAPLVFQAAEAGDGCALGILQENAAALADTVCTMLRVYGDGCPVVLAGGLLTENRRYQTLLRQLLAETAAQLIVPSLPPLYGAALLAAQPEPEEEPLFEAAFRRTFAAEGIEKRSCI